MLNACELAQQWLLSPELARRLVAMAATFYELTGHELEVISGHRSCDEQRLLGEQGRPAAPCELSTHVACPATGADLRMSGFPANQMKVAFGEAAMLSGLRWGGGSEFVNGIPSDWNHVDMGPRVDPVAKEYRSRLAAAR